MLHRDGSTYPTGEGPSDIGIAKFGAICARRRRRRRNLRLRIKLPNLGAVSGP